MLCHGVILDKLKKKTMWLEMQWWGKALPLVSHNAAQHVAGQCLIPPWGDREAPNTRGRGKPLGLSLPPRSRACFKQVARDFTCQVLSISKAGDLTASLDNLFQCLAMFMVKKFLIIPNLNFPCINLLPTAAPPSTTCLWEGLALSSLHPLLGCGV